MKYSSAKTNSPLSRSKFDQSPRDCFSFAPWRKAHGIPHVPMLQEVGQASRQLVCRGGMKLPIPMILSKN